jgi:hypothetical protein
LKDQRFDQSLVVDKYEIKIKQMFEDFFLERRKMEDEFAKEKTML